MCITKPKTQPVGDCPPTGCGHLRQPYANAERVADDHCWTRAVARQLHDREGCMMASQAQFWADGFDIGPSRRMRPMSGEDVDLIEGYYYLDRSERYATSEAITTHRDQIALWYRSLTYYNRALDLPRIISSNNLWLPQWRILRLGICASKAGLDALKGGTTSSPSVAFGIYANAGLAYNTFDFSQRQSMATTQQSRKRSALSSARSANGSMRASTHSNPTLSAEMKLRRPWRGRSNAPIDGCRTAYTLTGLPLFKQTIQASTDIVSVPRITRVSPLKASITAPRSLSV